MLKGRTHDGFPKRVSHPTAPLRERRRGPIDRNFGIKEALALRLRKLAIDSEKTLPGDLRTLFQCLTTALTGPPEPASHSSTPEIGALSQGYRVPRAIELVCQARCIGEVRRSTREVLRPPEVEIHTRRPAPGRALGVGCHQVVRPPE